MNKLFILIAYPYFSEKVYNALKERDPDEYELIIDSGAFSVFKSGKTIELDDYHKFLDSVSDLPILKAIQLDVMGDEKKSWDNFLKSRSLGYNVAPVFTRGTNINEIEKMYEYSDLVFIGATRGVGGPGYVKYVLENNKNRNCHILGTLNTEFLKHYKPYSCDVSSWISAARYGTLNVYKGGGELYQIMKKDFIRRPAPDVLKKLSKLGFTDREITFLGKKQCWVYSGYHSGEINENNLKSTTQFFNTVSWVYRQREIYNKLGTKAFMAFCDERQLGLIFNARDFLRKRGVI